MTREDRWLLPEGVEEVLPPRAWRLEMLRRRLLDLYRGWGYELIEPPLIEYLESLLTGSGNDLDLQTFKLIDQLSGRLLGVRADMTPQAARIDAHRLQREEPVRLCYFGPVLRARAGDLAASRSPLQVGAELFGHAGIESDLEVLELMLETLAVTGVREVHVDLGHVGIFRGLARHAGLDAEQEAVLFDALQRKALPEIGEFLDGISLEAAQRRRLSRLAGLHGGVEVLDEARAVLDGADAQATAALAELEAIARGARERLPEVPLYFDLAELRGYRYQTGVVFAAFVPGCGREAARGGRYDEIGRVFGRARPATGFSADFQMLAALGEGSAAPEDGGGAIFAPADGDPALAEKVRELRGAGEHVIRALPGQAGDARAMGCDRLLERRDGRWRVTYM